MKISNKAITNKFLIKSFFIAILIIGVSATIVFAWTEPTLSPPDGNASAPINIGTTSQGKLGNLGVGTTTPIEKFEIYSGNIRVRRPDNSATMGQLLTQGVDDLWRTYTTNDSASDLRFRAGATDHMTIQYSNGYVGIGTMTPGFRLEVTDGQSTSFNSSNFSGSEILGRHGGGTVIIGDTYVPTWAKIGGSFISSHIGQNYTNIGVLGIAQSTSGVDGTIGGLFDAYNAGASGDTIGVNIRYVSGGANQYGIYQSQSAVKNYFAGNVGIGTTNPGSAALAVNNLVNILNGGLNIGGGAGITMTGNISNVAKLTVATIDPVYEINGKKYATYAASIAGGVKEEYTGKAKLSEIKSPEYEYIIDFDKIEVGSDLWVWRKAVDFSRDNVDILITPYGESADIYYLIEGNKIIIRGDKPVEFSYRLTGKRFDWQNWPTLSKDQNEKASFIIK